MIAPTLIYSFKLIFDRSSLSVAWSIEAQLMIFVGFIFPGVLVGRPGITPHFVSVESSSLLFHSIKM